MKAIMIRMGEKIRDKTIQRRTLTNAHPMIPPQEKRTPFEPNTIAVAISERSRSPLRMAATIIMC